MSAIKAFAIDLDHTLLNDNLQISRKNLESIRLAHSSGIKIIIATGRMTSATLKPLKEVLDFIDFFVCFNGCKILKNDYKLIEIKNTTIPHKELAHIYKEIDITNFNIIGVDDNTIYSRSTSTDSIIDYYQLRTGAKLAPSADINHLENNPVNKVLIYSKKTCNNYNPRVESEFEKETLDIINRISTNNLDSRMTRLGYIECTPLYTSKMSAIETILELEGLHVMNLAAIGDGYNDIEMIENSGLGIAVKNAVPKLKKVATRIVADNNNSAISEAINLFT